MFETIRTTWAEHLSVPALSRCDRQDRPGWVGR